ncbi:hypothetical protein PHMEG_00013128, partial [Phytophthora megakarya]
MTCFAHYPGKKLVRYAFASCPNKAVHRNVKTAALLTALLIFNRPSSRSCPPISFAVSVALTKSIQALLEMQLRDHERCRHNALFQTFKRHKIEPPRSVAACMSGDTVPVYPLDHEMKRALSELVQVSGMSLLELVQLWRNQSAHDERPNKALNTGWTSALLRDFQFHDLVVNIISTGVQHEFPIHIGSSDVPKNHKSARQALNALRRSVRQGQDDGTYLVVDLDVARQWNILRFSPFGCVPKKDVDPR